MALDHSTFGLVLQLLTLKSRARGLLLQADSEMAQTSKNQRFTCLTNLWLQWLETTASPHIF